MPRIERTITVDTPPDKVWNYLSDFRSTNDWDPGTVETTVVSGDGGVGTIYSNVSKFGGRKVKLTYIVVGLDPGRMIALRGENKTVTANDTITVVGDGATGTTVEYVADFEFHGLSSLFTPISGPFLKKLGDDAAESLRHALELI